jgi:molybdopterin-guanine dinucleotide biosynthesis protein B
MKKRLAVAFSGPSNSGKTTFIEKIAKILVKDFKVVIIKHDPRDKAIFDIEGKDSYRFYNTGADVVVTSPTRYTNFSHTPKDIEQIIDSLDDFDYLLVEGLKSIALPRISIFRNNIDESYLKYTDILAIDNSIDKDSIKIDIDIIDLNNPLEAIEWINKNAKRV